MKKRDRDNLNPTPEAAMAMEIFPNAYGEQNGGSMDFWNCLTEAAQRRCKDAVDRVLKAAAAHGRTIQ